MIPPPDLSSSCSTLAGGRSESSRMTPFDEDEGSEDGSRAFVEEATPTDYEFDGGRKDLASRSISLTQQRERNAALAAMLQPAAFMELEGGLVDRKRFSSGGNIAFYGGSRSLSHYQSTASTALPIHQSSHTSFSSQPETGSCTPRPISDLDTRRSSPTLPTTRCRESSISDAGDIRKISTMSADMESGALLKSLDQPYSFGSKQLAIQRNPPRRHTSGLQTFDYLNGIQSGNVTRMLIKQST